jgi:hypothetical protein
VSKLPSTADLTGMKFSRLLALRPAEGAHIRSWHVRCDCGVETVKAATSLVSGGTKSCGCLVQEWRLAWSMGKKIREREREAFRAEKKALREAARESRKFDAAMLHQLHMQHIGLWDAYEQVTPQPTVTFRERKFGVSNSCEPQTAQAA